MTLKLLPTPPLLGCLRGPPRMRPAEHKCMQKYSVLLHSPAQDRQPLETEGQFAAVRSERLEFQAFATNAGCKLILFREVYLYMYTFEFSNPYPVARPEHVRRNAMPSMRMALEECHGLHGEVPGYISKQTVWTNLILAS